MTDRAMKVGTLAAALALAGCGWLPDAYTGCDEAQPYQSAVNNEPLKVPAGADLPDTRNALKIPELNTPELPREPGSCLEHPPPYAAGPAQQQQQQLQPQPQQPAPPTPPTPTS